MVKITEEQKKKYVENGGRTCPFCGSTEIDSDSLDADGSVAIAKVECLDCHKVWEDIFTLTGIGEAEEAEEDEEE